MERPDSWMPLYIGDYLADTRHLTTYEHGVYLLLIMAYWRNGGPIPNDDNYLKRVVHYQGGGHWSLTMEHVKSFFVTENGSLRHKRIDIELERASKAYANRKAAAMQRWSKASAKHMRTTTTLTIRKGISENGSEEREASKQGNGHLKTYTPPPDDTDEIQMKARAKAIANSGRSLMSVSEHTVRTMVAKGYLTTEQAIKAGYSP